LSCTMLIPQDRATLRSRLSLATRVKILSTSLSTCWPWRTHVDLLQPVRVVPCTPTRDHGVNKEVSLNHLHQHDRAICLFILISLFSPLHRGACSLAKQQVQLQLGLRVRCVHADIAFFIRTDERASFSDSSPPPCARFHRHATGSSPYLTKHRSTGSRSSSIDLSPVGK
jgi:hypothetical protein